MDEQKSNAKKKDTRKLQKERIIFLLLNFKGQVIEVTTKSGEIFEGIFHTSNVEKEFAVVLKYARLKNSQNNSNIINTLVIQSKDIVDLTAKDITFANDKEQYQRDDTFVIDGVITKNKDVKEKELVPWLPDQNDQMVLSNSSSGDLESSRNGSWNQFEVNERKYGVKSSYNENFYTTELDKSSKFYKEHIKNAEQLAHEIETSTMMIGNVQVAIDRGINVDMNEEDLYSSVIRINKEEGKYIPPHERKLETGQERGRSHSSGIKPNMEDQDSGRNRSSSVLPPPMLNSQVSPVLGLDPASPTITPEIYNEYRKFTQQEQINKKNEMRKPKETEISDIKKFSKEFQSKLNSKEQEPKLEAKTTSLNINAKAFVFNPSTPSFTPKSFTPSGVTPVVVAPLPPTKSWKKSKLKPNQLISDIYISNFKLKKEYLKEKTNGSWSIPKSNPESYKQLPFKFMPIPPPFMVSMDLQGGNQFLQGPPMGFIPHQGGGPPPQFYPPIPTPNTDPNFYDSKNQYKKNKPL